VNIKPATLVLKRPLCTWVTEADYRAFASVANANKTTMAAYLRAIVVDAVAEETAKSKKLVVVR
jgi:hypothetical protein